MVWQKCSGIRRSYLDNPIKQFSENSGAGDDLGHDLPEGVGQEMTGGGAGDDRGGGAGADPITSHSFEPVIEPKPSVVSLEKKPQTGPATRFDPLTEKPRNVSDEIWLDWISHRREIKQPLTPTSCRRIRSMLEKHTNPDAVIGLSLEHGWRGLFPEKITEPAGAAFRTSGLSEAQRRELVMYEFLEGR